jgi:vacuolar-type H+-ATPase subunit E/Vma4
MRSREEKRIILTMDPEELRRLADEMDEMGKTLKLGFSNDCYVGTISHSPRIDIYLDQGYFERLKNPRID